MLGIVSRGMRRIPNLSVFLEQDIVFRPPFWRKVDAMAGWGQKPTARRARHLARKRNIPYIAVEDGFYRSLGLGVDNYPPLSLVVDPVGIYYDASAPSLLENLLEGEEFPDSELEEARGYMDRIVRYELSKYNHAPPLADDLLPDDGRPRVLVVDQTRGDCSVTLGLADEHSFVRMLAHARDSHPDAHIIVKVHPDVIAGKKRGYLSEVDLKDCLVLADDVNPMALIKRMDHVCTVSSQMGFEALLAGRPVTCFGMPFYAGWGLTTDHVRCERRTRTRKMEELFAAACMRYARYVNLFTGEPGSLDETLDILWDQKRANDRLRGPLVCAAFSTWRRSFSRHFLSTASNTVHFRRTARGAVNKAKKLGGRVVVWHAKAPEGIEELCESHGVPLVRLEDGFIRSKGLGAHLNWPHSLSVDTRGIHYDPSRESDLEYMIKNWEHDEHLLNRARRLRKMLVERNITKYNLDEHPAPVISSPEGKKKILVLGQVDGDASVRLGGMGIDNNLDFLNNVRKRNPDAYIIYKPHPDVTAGKRPGEIPRQIASKLYDLEVRDTALNDLFDQVDEVHVLTSLGGFEALIRGKEVHVYGAPFYVDSCKESDNTSSHPKVTIELLIAITLIMYPTYYDYRYCCDTTPEHIILFISQPKDSSQTKQ